MIKDLVSIVVPTYNDEKYLIDSIDDLLKQTYEKIEIIIVNDGSTDSTKEILNKYSKNNKIKILEKENGGTGSALNYGFSVANGEFATWVSSDDRKNHNMIERLVSFLQKNRDVEFVTSAFHSDYLNMDLRAFTPDDLSIKGYKRAYFGKNNGQCTGLEFKVDEWVDINYEQCYQGVNFMFTMNLKNSCGPYIEMPGEDYHMTAMMGLITRVGYIDEVLGTHKNPPDSLSNMNRACVAQANALTRSLIEQKHKIWYLNKIPKIAHFYWGSESLSYLRFMTIKSFKLLNPDWSIVLYIPKNITKEIPWNDKNHRSDTQDYSGKDYWKEVEKLAIKIVKVDFPDHIKQLGEAQKSDFLRWRVLYKDGGCWSDMDILYTKSLKSFYFNNKDNMNLDNTVSCDEKFGHQIGFYLTCPKNPMFSELVKMTLSKNQIEYYQDLGCYLVNSLGNENKIKVKFNTNILNIQQEELYKFNHTMLDKIYEQNHYEEIQNITGIHWYGGAELSQKYNNLLNDSTYKNYNNTISKVLEKINE